MVPPSESFSQSDQVDSSQSQASDGFVRNQSSEFLAEMPAQWSSLMSRMMKRLIRSSML